MNSSEKTASTASRTDRSPDSTFLLLSVGVEKQTEI